MAEIPLRPKTPMNRDPFDIEWRVTDPVGHDVVLLKSTVRAREMAGKHPGPPERLEPDDAKTVVQEPTRIDVTVRTPKTRNYYKRFDEETYPYARVTVVFDESDDCGKVISWSRYEKTVSMCEVEWPV